jgi:hypothetical protein
VSFGGGVGESTHPAVASVANEALLAEGLERLAAATPFAADLLEAFGAFVRTADDEALVRINPVAFAERYGLPAAAVVELFLHARKLGLVAMEWQYVCPGCGEIVERLTSLTSATAHYFCQVCSADRDTDLSNFVEVTFSVSPDVRRSPYHDPWSLTPEEHFFRYRFTLSLVHQRPGAHRRRLADEPAALVRVRVQRGSHQRFAAEMDAGPVEVEFTNATAERYALMIIGLPDDYEVTMQPFLSGTELLSNQTFLDLFAD